MAEKNIPEAGTRTPYLLLRTSAGHSILVSGFSCSAITRTQDYPRQTVIFFLPQISVFPSLPFNYATILPITFKLTQAHTLKQYQT